MPQLPISEVLNHPWNILNCQKPLQTLTIPIFINQLKYPVNHLVWGQQITFFIQLSMAGFLQPINRLRVTGKDVTMTPSIQPIQLHNINYAVHMETLK